MAPCARNKPKTSPAALWYMRAEHSLSTGRPRPRATASRAHIRQGINESTMRPPRARNWGCKVLGVLWGWCVLYWSRCGRSRSPNSLPHFYTYWHTCISLMTATMMDRTEACRGGLMRPPRPRREHSSSECRHPTGHINDHALRVGASIQQAHDFAYLRSSESLKPVVVD